MRDTVHLIGHAFPGVQQVLNSGTLRPVRLKYQAWCEACQATRQPGEEWVA